MRYWLTLFHCSTVVIGGTTVKKQVIELAKKVSSAFTSDKADGLVGLAFNSINTGMYKPLYGLIPC